MNLKELQGIVTKGESGRVEFKRSTGQRSEAAKTVCAMLNGLGGLVLFGVADRGQIVGQEVAAKTLEDVAAELRRIEPPAFPDIETVPVKRSLSVIVLRVAGGGGPYAYDGRPYLRHGSTTVVMPRAEYERRLIERLHATRRWENEPAPKGVGIEDLDEEEIRLTVENAIRLGRLEPQKRNDLKTLLRGLELIHDGQLLNAALALYGKSESLRVLFPQFSIRLARFRGVRRTADFADNRQYWGHAFGLLRRAESFLMDHVPIAGKVISGQMRRQDHPWYPPRATREALANALCHRDYASAGGSVAVAMYDDHLEITNPGIFHFGITPETLSQPHESRPWNPIIAGVFYRAGVIEKWGSGSLNIIDWCEENRNPAPEWKEEAETVIITFLPFAGAMAEKATAQVTTQVTTHVTTQVTTHVREMLQTCESPLTSSEIQQRLGLQNREHFRKAYLAPAIKNGWLERTIPDKPRSRLQRYRLTDKGRAWLAGNPESAVSRENAKNAKKGA